MRELNQALLSVLTREDSKELGYWIIVVEFDSSLFVFFGKTAFV